MEIEGGDRKCGVKRQVMDEMEAAGRASEKDKQCAEAKRRRESEGEVGPNPELATEAHAASRQHSAMGSGKSAANERLPAPDIAPGAATAAHSPCSLSMGLLFSPTFLPSSALKEAPPSPFSLSSPPPPRPTSLTNQHPSQTPQSRGVAASSPASDSRAALRPQGSTVDPTGPPSSSKTPRVTAAQMLPPQPPSTSRSARKGKIFARRLQSGSRRGSRGWEVGPGLASLRASLQHDGSGASGGIGGETSLSPSLLLSPTSPLGGRQEEMTPVAALEAVKNDCLKAPSEGGASAGVEGSSAGGPAGKTSGSGGSEEGEGAGSQAQNDEAAVKQVLLLSSGNRQPSSAAASGSGLQPLLQDTPVQPSSSAHHLHCVEQTPTLTPPRPSQPSCLPRTPGCTSPLPPLLPLQRLAASHRATLLPASLCLVRHLPCPPLGTPG